jgi:hypothetical protein
MDYSSVFSEMEFLDIILIRLESFTPFYSQPLLLADFKESVVLTKGYMQKWRSQPIGFRQ